MNNKDLKIKTKNDLKGKYKDTIILMILHSAITCIIIFIINLIFQLILSKFKLNINQEMNELIQSIIIILVTSLFYYGQLSYYIHISRNQKVKFTELFKKTDMWFGYIWITLLTTIFTYLWSILFIIPGIIAAYSYQLVHYIKVDSPHINSLEAIKYSKELMKGNKFKLFILQLSFIGWIIIGILTLGIGFFWIIPYIQVTLANFYNSLIPERYSESINQIEKSNYIIHSKEQLYQNKQKNIKHNNNTNKKNIEINEIPTWNIGNINTTINNDIQNNNNNNNQ